MSHVTTAKKKPFKVTKHVAHTAWQPPSDGKGPVTGSRVVTIGGVTSGHRHRVYIRGEVADDRTVCGNFIGANPPTPDARPCPVCFKDELTG